MKIFSKRALAVLLALMMCVGMLNLTVFASDGGVGGTGSGNITDQGGGNNGDGTGSSSAGGTTDGRYSVSYDWGTLPELAEGVTVTLPDGKNPNAGRGLNGTWKPDDTITVDSVYCKGYEIEGADGVKYTFSGWTVEGMDVVDGKFTMPAHHVTIKGEWTKVDNGSTDEPDPETPQPTDKVTVTKTADKTTVKAGDKVKYIVTIANNTNGDLTVKVTDILPEGLELSGGVTISGAKSASGSASGSGSVFLPGMDLDEFLAGLNGDGYVKSLSNIEVTIEAGKTVTLTYSATVQEGASGKLTNNVTVTVDGDDAPGKTADADVTVDTTPEAEKHTVTYNDGTNSETDGNEYAEGDTVTVREAPETPEGKEFAGWTDGETVYEPGDTFEMPDEDVILRAKWNELQTQTADEYGLVVVKEITSGKKVRNNGTVEYEVTITNNGTGTLQGLTVTDLMDSHLSLIFNSCASTEEGTFVQTDDGYKWTMSGDFAPGATVTLTYSATVSVDENDVGEAGKELPNRVAVEAYYITSKDNTSNYRANSGIMLMSAKPDDGKIQVKVTVIGSANAVVTVMKPSVSYEGGITEEIGDDTTVKTPEEAEVEIPEGKVLDHWVDEDGNEYKPGDLLDDIVDDIVLTPVWKDAEPEHHDCNCGDMPAGEHTCACETNGDDCDCECEICNPTGGSGGTTSTTPTTPSDDDDEDDDNNDATTPGDNTGDDDGDNGDDGDNTGDGDIDIPDGDTPLGDLPDIDIPEEDPPLSDTPDVEIPEEDPPLSDLPELDIPDGDVPLAGVPDTGDYSHIWGVVALISGMGLAVLVLTNKKREEIAE